MKGYICEKCDTELFYEQIQGIRLRHESNGVFYYNVYCPNCKDYFSVDENNKRITED